MDDFPGLLARDYGFKPQGKSAPMAPPRNSSSSNYNNFGLGSSPPDNGRPSSSSKSKSSSNPIFDDNGGDGLLFNDVFGAPSKYRSSDSRGPPEPSTSSDFDYDSIFKDQTSAAKSASIPVFDKPVYDEDIFEGLPGVKTSASTSASTSGKYEDVFSSISSSPKLRKEESSLFDDLLGNFGRKEVESKKVERPRDTTAFDDLIPGFGGRSSPNKNR